MKNFKKEHAAIVLGLDTGGLGMIRSLGSQGLTVYGFDYQRSRRYGFYSRYVKAGLCPHPVYNPEQLAQFLIKEFDKGKKPVLFATADEFVKFISDQRDILQERFLFILPSKETMANIIDKQAQYESVKKLGVITPDTCAVSSWDDLQSIHERIQYPVIIKGRYSFQWRDCFGGTLKGFVLHNSTELLGKGESLFHKKIPFLIQNIVAGPASNIFQIYGYRHSAHNIFLTFIIRKIRQFPPHFGNGSSIESTANDNVSSEGRRIFSGLQFEGFGAIEFKYDEMEKDYRFIELNPRLAMQNHLTTACGLNFPLMQYLDLTQQILPELTPYKKGVRWVDPVQDFKSFRAQKKSLLLSLWGWVRFVLGCRVFSTFALFDPQPFLISIKYGVSILKIPIFLAAVLLKRKDK